MCQYKTHPLTYPLILNTAIFYLLLAKRRYVAFREHVLAAVNKYYKFPVF